MTAVLPESPPELPPSAQAGRPHWRVYLWGAGLIALGCGSMAACALFDMLEVPSDTLTSLAATGLIFGALLGQMSAATYWLALGPGRVLLRVTASIIWLILLVVSFALLIEPSNLPEALGFFGLPMLAHLVLCQPLLWGILKIFRLRLRHSGDPEPLSPTRRQFGIGQLLIVTTLVAVLLAAGRLLWSHTDFVKTIDEELFFTVSVNLGLLICTLPIALTALLHRRAALSIVVALVLVPAVTGGEIMLQKLIGMDVIDLGDLLATNFFASAWVLAFAAVARRCSYRLERMPARGTAATRPEAA